MKGEGKGWLGRGPDHVWEEIDAYARNPLKKVKKGKARYVI